MKPRRINYLLSTTAFFAALSLGNESVAQGLINSPEHPDAYKSPFCLDKEALRNLNMPFYTAAYTTGNVVVVTTDDIDFQIFHPDGRPVAEGKWRIAGAREEGLRLENGTMVAKSADVSDKHLYLIREDGTVTKLPPTVINCTSFRDGLAIATVQAGRPYQYKQVYIDPSGKQLPSPEGLDAAQIQDLNADLRCIPPLRDGRRAYYDKNKYKWGYVDAHGKVVIPATFDKARSFNEGMAPVQRDGTIFYINPSGEPANGLRFPTSDYYLYEVSDYSSGYCVVKYPAQSPDYLRTYYNTDGNEEGKLSNGAPFHDGVLYYMDVDDRKNRRAFRSEKIGQGVKVADKSTHWGTYWDGYTVLPRYDEYGVGHTDNKYVTVGKQRPDNMHYKFPYGYLSDFSNAGYAIAWIEDENYKYKGVVDHAGNFVSLISMEEK